MIFVSLFHCQSNAGQIIVQCSLSLHSASLYKPLFFVWSGAGKEFKLDSPYGDELPEKGFDRGEDTYQAPPASGQSLSVNVNPKSDRLQLLSPFDQWNGKDLENMTVLIKVSSHLHSTFSPNPAFLMQPPQVIVK